ncbi:MAG: hypothetical protein WD490_03345 [Opitutales bacterium]
MRGLIETGFCAAVIHVSGEPLLWIAAAPFLIVRALYLFADSRHKFPRQHRTEYDT